MTVFMRGRTPLGLFQENAKLNLRINRASSHDFDLVGRDVYDVEPSLYGRDLGYLDARDELDLEVRDAEADYVLLRGYGGPYLHFLKKLFCDRQIAER